MSLPRIHKIVAIEVEDDLAGMNCAGNVGIYVGHRVAGYLEGEQLPCRVPIIFAEFLEVIRYLAVVL
jgi:hypothetical protein